MTDDLHDALTDIRGIGDATADEILDILDREPDDDLTSNIYEADWHHEAGRHEYAAKFVRRAAESIRE